MITLPVIKGLIPEIDAYIKEGNKLVFDYDENEKPKLDIDKFYDAKRECPYYTLQLQMEDYRGKESYFISATIYCIQKQCSEIATSDGVLLKTIVSYEIEHADKVRSVQTVIQTIDENKCLIERKIQKTQTSKRVETANISERFVYEERDDGRLVEQIMYPGEILVPYVSLVGSRKWAEYQNNPGNLTKVRNLRYITNKRNSISGVWE